MQAQHLKALTGLRFWAAMWVVLYHFWPHLQAPLTPLLVQKGYLGVELFFILSGFILCHVYLPPSEEGRFRYGPFLWARIARVYPLHLATLVGVGFLGAAATVAGMAIDANILAWSALPANLLMVHAWGFAPVSGWNHPSWSISAEWFAYLSFPAFAWLAIKLRARPMLAIAGALALLCGLYAFFERQMGFALTEATIRWGALRIVPCFAYGCAVYLCWRSGAVGRRTPAVLGAGFSGAAVLVSAAVGAPDAAIVSLFGVLILFLASLTSTGSRIGSGGISVWLGEISYAVYMTCVPFSLVFFNAVPKLMPGIGDQMPWFIWVFSLLGTVLVAALAHHLIERPARQMLRNWSWPRLSRGVKTTA
jgi:peptidoglycan/LPS O-acetylase OafA/YrhL